MLFNEEIRALVSAKIVCMEIFDVKIAIFRTLNVVSGEWYGGEIL